MAVWTVFLRFCQSMLFSIPRLRSGSSAPSVPSTNLDKLTDPRVQASYGNSGCSAHGFVDSIRPILGVGLARELFTLSIKIMPGSPYCQASLVTKSKTFLALRRPVILPVLGLI